MSETVAVFALIAAVLAGASLVVSLVIYYRQRDRVDHAKCIAHVASVTSNAFVAERVRALADRYDSVDGEAELTRIRNTTPLSDRSIPAHWLREQADLIEGVRVEA